MSKKYIAVAGSAIGLLVLAGAVSVFAAGSQPVIPPPFRIGPSSVQYTLTLVQNGVSKTLELHSWSWGLENSTNVSGGSGAGASAPKFSGLSFTANSSSLSPLLMQAAAEGMHFTVAELMVTESGTTTMVIKLGEAMLTSYQMTGGSGGSEPQAPVDSGTLTFSKISVASGGNSAAWDLQAQSSGGASGAGGWNLTQNKSL